MDTNNCQRITRNIRKPGGVGDFNFCTFIQNHNGLISMSSEIPASAYYHPLAGIVKLTRTNRETDF